MAATTSTSCTSFCNLRRKSQPISPIFAKNHHSQQWVSHEPFFSFLSLVCFWFFRSLSFSLCVGFLLLIGHQEIGFRHSIFLTHKNVQHSETPVSTSEVKHDDGFSGWKADFQSADSGNQHEGARSFDPFVGSTVDLSAHMDSMFGPGKDVADEKSASTPLALATNDDFLASPQADKVDETIKSKDGITADNLYNDSSTTIDWFPDDQWLTNSMIVPDNKTSSEDNDSFGVWQQISNQKVVGSPPTWRRRWFVLQQGTLLWFKDFSVTRASLPRGVIFVATCLPVKGAEDVLNKPFAFELSTARITESCGCQEGQPGVVDEVKEKALPHSGVLM